MKKSILLIEILFFSIVVFGQKASDDFTGKWKAPKGAIIIITKSPNGFIGKTEVEKAVVLEDVKFSDGKWVAVIMNPKENKIANCELLLEAPKLRILVRKGILYKTIIWTKQ